MKKNGVFNLSPSLTRIHKYNKKFAAFKTKILLAESVVTFINQGVIKAAVSSVLAI